MGGLVCVCVCGWCDFCHEIITKQSAECVQDDQEKAGVVEAVDGNAHCGVV